MYSAITLATLCLSLYGASAASLKSLLQAEQDVVLPNPELYGFSNQTCNFTFTPPPGSPPGSTPNTTVNLCSCSLSNTTSGLPALGQAQVNAFSLNSQAKVGANMLTTPDTQLNYTQAAEVCSCTTSTFAKARTLVKTNSF